MIKTQFSGDGHRFLFFAAVFVTLFLFIFLPIAQIPFATHDDVTFLGPKIPGIIQYYSSVGRPVASLAIGWSLKFIHTIEDLSRLRIAVVVCHVLSASLLALFLVRSKFRVIEAIGASLLLVMLPGMLVPFLWVVLSPLACATFFALFAAFVYLQAERAVYGPQAKHRAMFLFLYSGAFLLLELSLFTYPAVAGFFLLPIFCECLFLERASTRSIVARGIKASSFYLACTAVYFGVTKFCLIPYLQKHNIYSPPANTNDRFELVSDFCAKAKWCWDDLIPRLFRLWDITGGHSLGKVCLGIIGLACGIILFRSLKGKKESTTPPFWFFANFGIFVLFMVLVNFPNLLSAGGTSAFRTILVGSAFVVIALIWAVEVIVGYERRWIPIVLTSGIVSLNAQTICSAHARNLNLEYVYLRGRVCEHLSRATSLSCVVVIAPQGNETYVGRPWRKLGFFDPHTVTNNPEFLHQIEAVNGWELEGYLSGISRSLNLKRIPQYYVLPTIELVQSYDNSVLMIDLNMLRPKPFTESSALANIFDSESTATK